MGTTRQTPSSNRSTMGRRKIDIAYITDDRVRKVTFCKRKGGLFKKAEDLSKLCGVEIAVIIVGEKKTNEFASTDMRRILERYHAMNSGNPVIEGENETDRLWSKLETQRRELEAMTRELAARDAFLQQQQAALMPVATMPAPLLPTLPMEQLQQIQTEAAASVAVPLISADVSVVGEKRDRDHEEVSDDTAEVEDGISDIEGREDVKGGSMTAKRARRESNVAANIQHYEALAAANAKPVAVI